MKFSSVFLSIGTLLASTSFAKTYQHVIGSCENDPETIASELYRTFNLRRDTIGATTLSYIYGFPLIQYAKSRVGIGRGMESTNTLTTNGRLARFGDNSVIRPNVDTVYARMYFDLSTTELIITVPEIPSDRYVLFSFFDPFGDSFAGIGSPYSFSPGKYLLKSSLRSGLVGVKSCKGYTGCVYSPTLDGLLLIRYAVTSEAESTTAVSYFNNTEIELHEADKITSPWTQNDIDLKTMPNDTVLQTMTLLSRLRGRDPPQLTAFAAAMDLIFDEAGIGNGTYTDPEVNTTAAQKYFSGALAAFGGDPTRNFDLGNGWQVLSLATIGRYNNGTDILSRSVIAFWGYLANPPNEAIYPATSIRTLSIENNESVLIRFSAKPQLPANGFWSLTIYDGDGYLFETPQRVYGLGDRSLNMTYSDGTKVYGSNSGKDGPFDILVQASDVEPPRNWTNNWLPAPAGGGFYQLTLRLFNADETYLSGSYIFPALSKQLAVVS